MGQKKVVVLDTAGTTLDVPQGTDTYLLAEDVAITGNLSITGVIANTAGDTTIEATGANSLIVQQAGTADVWISGGSDVTLVSGGSSVIVDSSPAKITINSTAVDITTSTGDINLAPTSGKVILDGSNWPTGLGTNGYALTTNGAGQTAWSAIAGTGDLKADGTVPLTANWDVGAYKITAAQLESDVITGTAPLVVASTTVVANLNASKLEGNAASAFAAAAHTHEGTAVLSTGEVGGTKFLREDGDGTSSWQAVPAAGLSNVVEDTTPQLGGDLDINAKKIISVSNANIDIEPNGTGNVLLGNFTFNADQTIGAGQDNMVMTYDHAAGTIGLETPAGGTEPFYGTIFIETVANQDYELSFDMPFAGTVTTLRTKSQSGTCTVTGKIGTTALGGTANSASSVASEQAHSSANTWVKGNTLKVAISANAACTDLEIAWMGTVS